MYRDDIGIKDDGAYRGSMDEYIPGEEHCSIPTVKEEKKRQSGVWAAFKVFLVVAGLYIGYAIVTGKSILFPDS